MENTGFFCTTIIPTVGRKTLDRTVWSVLEQLDGNIAWEIVVVNDSGNILPYSDWQSDSRVRIVNTMRRERSVARNTGAAIARGKYLHFLDDDDFLLPGAIQILFDAARPGNTAWVYGNTVLVDGSLETIGQFRTGCEGNCFLEAMAGEWIPIQSSLIRADAFFEVGGFRSELRSGGEDTNLCRLIALRYDFHFVDFAVSCVVRDSTESTSASLEEIVIATRAMREAILSRPDSHKRLSSTIKRNSYWFGRLVRLYWSSSLWNLSHGHWSIAIARLISGFRVLPAKPHWVLSKDFRNAVLGNHVTPVYEWSDQVHTKLDSLQLTPLAK